MPRLFAELDPPLQQIVLRRRFQHHGQGIFVKVSQLLLEIYRRLTRRHSKKLTRKYRTLWQILYECRCFDEALEKDLGNVFGRQAS
ncbi:MAG: hypothetical protein NWR51_09605 [Akkermansiaceae bacterium]|nr:hypothetical protein [Akkermansiaceae bacterium]MDP4847504.1 hypothetical protein [Akkermansiaceae bacterium]MDP4898693.1 hypothetical protein [Akkermansiaceae bacterium]